jgi:hypothetical protein
MKRWSELYVVRPLSLSEQRAKCASEDSSMNTLTNFKEFCVNMIYLTNRTLSIILMKRELILNINPIVL